MPETRSEPRFVLFRWLARAAWTNGFNWGFKLGNLAVEYRLLYEYKKLRHAPRRTRAASRAATLHVHGEHLPTELIDGEVKIGATEKAD